jgi:hypothetical protein
MADTLGGGSNVGVFGNFDINALGDGDHDINLADLVFAIMSERGKLIEESVRNQVKVVDANNRRLQRINDLISKVSTKDGKYATDRDKDGNPVWKEGERQPLTQDDVDFLKSQGIDVANMKGFTATPIIVDDGTPAGKDENGYVFDTGGDGDTAATSISDALGKKASDLSTTSQTDMATLQSTMGKYNNTYDALSNFINKYGQSLGTIINNLR